MLLSRPYTLAQAQLTALELEPFARDSRNWRPTWARTFLVSFWASFSERSPQFHSCPPTNAIMSGIEQLLQLRNQLNAAIDTLVASPEGESLPALDDSLSNAPPALMTAPGAATASAMAQKITALLAGPHRGFALSLSVGSHSPRASPNSKAVPL